MARTGSMDAPAYPAGAIGNDSLTSSRDIPLLATDERCGEGFALLAADRMPNARF
jgi:hypothetical protein